MGQAVGLKDSGDKTQFTDPSEFQTSLAKSNHKTLGQSGISFRALRRKLHRKLRGNPAIFDKVLDEVCDDVSYPNTGGCPNGLWFDLDYDYEHDYEEEEEAMRKIDKGERRI